MKITQSDIKYIMNEAVRLINEHIINESKKSDKNAGKDSKKGSEGESFSNDSDDIDVHALKNKGLNLAQYAYRLYPNMDKASARSKFYKKIKHDKVTDGYSKKKDYKYSLTPSEAATVNNLITKPLTVKK